MIRSCEPPSAATTLLFKSKVDNSRSDLKMSFWSSGHVCNGLQAHTSWPPLLWTRSTFICICVLAKSAQASRPSQVHQRTRRQLTPCRSRDLVQLPLACDQHSAHVLARMPGTKLCEVRAPLDVPPTLELPTGSEVVLSSSIFGFMSLSWFSPFTHYLVV